MLLAILAFQPPLLLKKEKWWEWQSIKNKQKEGLEIYHNQAQEKCYGKVGQGY